MTNIISNKRSFNDFNWEKNEVVQHLKLIGIYFSVEYKLINNNNHRENQVREDTCATKKCGHCNFPNIKHLARRAIIFYTKPYSAFQNFLTYTPKFLHTHVGYVLNTKACLM